MTREIVLLVRACGIPVEDAIRAATSHAATAAWFENVGVIAPGCDADLVVVDGNLTNRIELLEDERHIAAVIRKGAVVSATAPATA